MTDALAPPRPPLHRWLFELLKAAGKEFGADNAGRMGAALSFYTLFSLVPLLFLASAVAGFVLGDPDVLARVVDQVEQVVGATVAEQIAGILQGMGETAGAALTIGVLLAAFSASGIFLQVRKALDQIFGAPEDGRSGIINAVIDRLVALVSAVVLAVAVLIPLVAVAAIDFLVGLIPGDQSALAAILRIGVPIGSLVLLVLVVGITFQALTRTQIPWAAALRGGVFTGVLGLAAAYGVGLFFSQSQPGEGGRAFSALGVIGGVAILLVFFNLMWQVFLFGAEVTKVYADYLDLGDIQPPSERETPSTPPRPSLPDSVVHVGVFAFLTGLVIGWWRRP